MHLFTLTTSFTIPMVIHFRNEETSTQKSQEMYPDSHSQSLPAGLQNKHILMFKMLSFPVFHPQPNVSCLFVLSLSKEWMSHRIESRIVSCVFRGIGRSSHINRYRFWNHVFIVFSPSLIICEGLNFWDFSWTVTEGKLPKWDNYWPQQLLPWNLLVLKLVLMFLINFKDDQQCGFGIKAL